ncbi:MAG: hypothetical protein KGI38_01020 [Thaumarchaeota archaeon]|nr:hypothetical protein [Nitrososphaerota archaeon]
MRIADVAIVAIFSSLVVGSDFALTPFVNFKLMDVVVFLVAFAFGFRQGAMVAVLSETIWSVVSPWGPAGLIAPFLIVGELLFAVAGWAAARVWADKKESISPHAVFIGATLAICAFIWDFETNAATALIAGWPGLNLGELISYELQGFVFPVPLAHEIADFALGTLLAPASLLLMSKVRRNS